MRLALLALAATLLLSASASAAKGVRNAAGSRWGRANPPQHRPQGDAGITPLSPASGATVPKDTRPTFRLRVHGKGTVWVRVCKSPKRHRDGTICDSSNFGRARRSHGSLYTYRPRLFKFAGYWLQTPGTYYWQAYRLDCVKSLKDCRQEGAVTRFRIG
jgi:hypothetical protein